MWRRLKGLEFLIKALPIVLKYIPGARFVLVGDGSDRGKLIALAQNLGVLNYLRFVGKLPWTEVLPYYRQADLFVLPSVSNPKPLVAPEALAAGLPLVASRVDGIQEIVCDGENGLLVTPGDSDALGQSAGSRTRRTSQQMLIRTS